MVVVLFLECDCGLGSKWLLCCSWNVTVVLALTGCCVVLPGPTRYSTGHCHGPGGAAADHSHLAEDTRTRTRPTGGSTA